MKSSIKNASARQHSGGPSTTPYRGDDRSNRRRSADIADVEREIAELVDRSTQDLRVGWRQLHRTEQPPGLSRDLIIRALAHQPQEGSYGEASRALRRRLQSLSAEFEKGAPCRKIETFSPMTAVSPTTRPVPWSINTPFPIGTAGWISTAKTSDTRLCRQMHKIPAPRRDRNALLHPRITASGTESLKTLRWREMDSNFQYAGAVNLVVGPFGWVVLCDRVRVRARRFWDSAVSDAAGRS